MKLAVVTVSTDVLADLARFYGQFETEYSGVLDLKLYYAGKRMAGDKLEEMKHSLEEGDTVIVDLMGSPPETVKAVIEALPRCKGNIIPIGSGGREFLRLGELNAGETAKPSMPPDPMARMGGMPGSMGSGADSPKSRDAANLERIGKYWNHAGADEIANLVYLLLRDYGGIRAVPRPQEPKEPKDISLCDPATGQVFENYGLYRDVMGHDEAKPVVALLYYGHSYPNRTSECVAVLAGKIREFANVLPVAFVRAAEKNMDILEDILMKAAGKKADLAVNFMSFRLSAGPMGGDARAAVDMLDRLDIPLLHPYFMSRRTEEEWKESPQGISSSEYLISVMLPELDGCLETYPVGAMASQGRIDRFDLELMGLSVIEERAERFAARVNNWLKLRYKPNNGKKVAIVCYNYPPGEDNIFGGAFLDTFASVENILKLLKEEGYSVEDLSAQELMEHFTAGGLVNSPRWSDESSSSEMIRYSSGNYARNLENAVYGSDLKEQWGPPPGGIMTEGKSFLIPGMLTGNIFIGLQPSRGIHEYPEKTYHDKALLPHHQYLAFYQWLREEYKADAVIHVGTHGTLEFLKGKECGMSGDCFPDLLLGDMPHIYLYYTGNPAEAMIAKRRSRALLVGYQPPAFTEGGLYGELTRLSALIDEYHESLRATPARSGEILKQIGAMAAEKNLPADLDELEGELYRMKRSLIPRGFHRFGEGFGRKEALEYAKSVLRYDRSDRKSLRRILAEDKGMDYDGLLESNETATLQMLDREVDEAFRDYGEKGRLPAMNKASSPEELGQVLDSGIKLAEDSMGNHEKEGLLTALRGGYLRAKLAGDAIRNPEVLPSGYNLYQFDPRFVPARSAYERGVAIAENTLKLYRKDHGEYPRSTAVVLWGLETSRTQGETFGQILAYLGIRVVQGRNAWEPKYEIIPAEELKRPRIDVVIHMCGFFRDMFPNLIDGLNQALERLASLEEPEGLNFYKANCRRIFAMLLEEGYDKNEALELSRSRIFGPAEGEYGTGVNRLIETRNWTEESQLGETFMKSLRHVYSTNYRGRAAEGLLGANLKAVDIVSQIRSSHEYEVTDLDHYYEYFGGLAKSVEQAKGRKSEIYISDSTGERMETEKAEKSIGRGVRTRLLNPRWIDGMLEHNYHGVQKISDRFENILGLAATTNRVENWIFKNLHATYISDRELRRRLAENNRWAYLGIVERLMECSSRGYWQATEAELEELKTLYLELEESIE